MWALASFLRVFRRVALASFLRVFAAFLSLLLVCVEHGLKRGHELERSGVLAFDVLITRLGRVSLASARHVWSTDGKERHGLAFDVLNTQFVCGSEYTIRL